MQNEEGLSATTLRGNLFQKEWRKKLPSTVRALEKKKRERDGAAEEDDKLRGMWRGKEMEQFVFENEKNISKT